MDTGPTRSKSKVEASYANNSPRHHGNGPRWFESRRRPVESLKVLTFQSLQVVRM